MFGKKNKGMGGFASGGTTLLSKSTEIVGDIHFSGNLEVEGIVRGNIVADNDARVRIMEKGLVEGEVTAPNIVINGRVVGNVHSSKHVELAANAVVEGNVHYNLIEMVKGAQVNGNLVFSPDGSEKPEIIKADIKHDKASKAKLSDAAII
jgi:cytoskeletal protein CcmA (bactofilin family)|tara:strand:- start:590 stop:1039 length:450 start_codon:yes stop_codon:yes gene_type:complete